MLPKDVRWVVDLDLEKFFDRVNHDILMSRVKRRVKDGRVLRLIDGYLKAGMFEGGVASARKEGTPQGGPLSPLLGWVNYFRYSEVKGPFEELDGWVRRKLRCILWRQWKRPFARAGNLMRFGLPEETAWKSATNGRGPWWNAGASHMHKAIGKSFFEGLGLVSFMAQHHRLQVVS